MHVHYALYDFCSSALCHLRVLWQAIGCFLTFITRSVIQGSLPVDFEMLACVHSFPLVCVFVCFIQFISFSFS